jgi:hypothetical protein
VLIVAKTPAMVALRLLADRYTKPGKSNAVEQ